MRRGSRKHTNKSGRERTKDDRKYVENGEGKIGAAAGKLRITFLSEPIIPGDADQKLIP